jgi:stage III sporulation protein AG
MLVRFSEQQQNKEKQSTPEQPVGRIQQDTPSVQADSPQASTAPQKQSPFLSIFSKPATKPEKTPTIITSEQGGGGRGGGGFANMFARVKKIKHIEIYAAVALILVMIAIYMSTLGGGASPRTPSNQNFRTNDDYARDLEARLVSTLSQVGGAGRVSAMVTVTGSATLEIAYNTDERIVTQGGANGAVNTTTTIVRTAVMINGSGGPQPLIIMEIKPKVRGVVVVSSGAANPAVRFQLERAVRALLPDPDIRIEILTGSV